MSFLETFDKIFSAKNIFYMFIIAVCLIVVIGSMAGACATQYDYEPRQYEQPILA